MEKMASTTGGMQGYLVTERDAEGRERILYAGGAACAMTGLSSGQLLGAEPARAAAGLEAGQVPLDGGHTLWILGRSGREAELEKKLAQAEEANRAKSRFLSNMSHDIRTPMNAIVGMAAIAMSHIDEKSRVQDCLHKMQTASAHLMSLVNDVLDMSRIDSGRMSLNEEEFSLADLVHDIDVIVQAQAAQKKQDLRIEIGEIRAESLVGDPLRLRQILVNIIGNAVKYTQEGGEIRAGFAQRLEPPAPGEEGEGVLWLDFSCRDNGIGMSQDFLERIFLPFERVRSTAVSRIEGTGLGMSIVKSLVDRMGGHIRVDSREGEGSLFRVELPLPPSPRAQTAPALPAGQTVLVAESRTGRLEQIAACLRSGGLEPVCVRTGLEAVTRLTEAQYEGRMPCALLLGRELADAAVLEVAAHVRQLAGQEFPILLVSEEDWAQIEYRAARAGVSAFVPCPLFPSRLLETISRLTAAGEGRDGGGERSADYSGRRVLLVEDNELNQEIAMELLGMTGVQVETAGDGRQAVERFAASPEGHYDLVFMDIQMPVMDGYEASRRIRALDRRDAEQVWIVAMTANAFVEDVRLSREAGMDEHVSKPVDLEHLQEVLGRLLSRKRDVQ